MDSPANLKALKPYNPDDSDIKELMELIPKEPTPGAGKKLSLKGTFFDKMQILIDKMEYKDDIKKLKKAVLELSGMTPEAVNMALHRAKSRSNSSATPSANVTAELNSSDIPESPKAGPASSSDALLPDLTNDSGTDNATSVGFRPAESVTSNLMGGKASSIVSSAATAVNHGATPRSSKTKNNCVTIKVQVRSTIYANLLQLNFSKEDVEEVCVKYSVKEVNKEAELAYLLLERGTSVDNVGAILTPKEDLADVDDGDEEESEAATSDGFVQ